MRILTLACAAALAMLSTGCRAVGPLEGTGVGRAWDQAWYGTPPEVVEAVQFMDKTMSRELRDKYAAIESATVTDPLTGQVNQEWAENRFRDLEATHADLEHWKALAKALAAYVGATLEEPIDFSTRQADIRRQEFWKSIQQAAEALKKPSTGP